mgnify:CR=1 FL=1|tara:strand:+ start:415 stop:705 length:291 start_codon:yes stop_codon:yes gene_type:complete
MEDNIYTLNEELEVNKLEGYVAIKNSYIIFWSIIILGIFLVSFGLFSYSMEVLCNFKDLKDASMEISRELDQTKTFLNDCNQSKIHEYENHKLINK